MSMFACWVLLVITVAGCSIPFEFLELNTMKKEGNVRKAEGLEFLRGWRGKYNDDIFSSKK